MNDDPVCRRHSVPLVAYSWDGYRWLYRCPVGAHECVSTWVDPEEGNE